MLPTPFADARIRRLERRVRVLSLSLVAMAALCLVSAMLPRAPEWLRCRGLIVEDAEGRPRVVLAAPVGKLEGRARTDEATGLVVLSPDGRDVLQLGRVGGPQMGGTVQPRMSAATGLAVADGRGNERGGFGVFDNGQAGWGLDYADGDEGLVAIVDSERKIGGLVLQAPGATDRQRMSLLTTSEGTSFELCDGAAKTRVQIEAPAQGDAGLRVLDAEGKPSFEAKKG
jgi:hypothetical protein